MQFLWSNKEGYLHDIVEYHEEPRPAYTTISTVLSRMCKKELIGFRREGRDKKYYPVLQKKEYFKDQLNGMISGFFNDSAAQFASFFTKETDISVDQLEELQRVIDEQLKLASAPSFST